MSQQQKEWLLDYEPESDTAHRDKCQTKAGSRAGWYGLKIPLQYLYRNTWCTSPHFEISSILPHKCRSRGTEPNKPYLHGTHITCGSLVNYKAWISVCLSVCLLFTYLKDRLSDLLHTWQVCRWASAVWNLVKFGHMSYPSYQKDCCGFRALVTLCSEDKSYSRGLNRSGCVQRCRQHSYSIPQCELEVKF